MKIFWKEYRFEDGWSIICRGLSKQELAVEIRNHGPLKAVIKIKEVRW